MALRFAAARCASRSPIARALAWRAIRRAANDNRQLIPANDIDERTTAALRLFAGHGLGSAGIAAGHARQAHREGDTQTARSWLAICFSLDRNMAGELERQLAEPVVLATE